MTQKICGRSGRHHLEPSLSISFPRLRGRFVKRSSKVHHAVQCKPLQNSTRKSCTKRNTRVQQKQM